MKVELSNISKYYEGKLIHALDNISLTVEAGQIVGLMGPSGSGKTTLLNIISTMDRPSRGRVALNGRLLAQLKPWPLFRARNIGFIFQFHHLLPHLTLLENVELPMLATEPSKKIRMKRASRLLEKVGLSRLQKKYASRISGGERQRAAIARALANSPKLILADEPTGNVDSHTGIRIMSDVIDYCHQHGSTLIVATHNSEIADMTGYVLNLSNGHLRPDK